MKTSNSGRLSNAPVADAAARRGRAVIFGRGSEAADGHTRCTIADHFRLLGGSEAVHEDMLRHADALVREIERRGFRLDSLAREDIPQVQRLIDEHLSVNRNAGC